MKVLPKGEVMLGGELTDKMQVSFMMRSLLSFLMKFAMSLNPFLHFGFGEDPDVDGKYEFPHLTFPLFRVMDRVIETPPGEELPELGKELPEAESDRALRRSGKGVNCFKEGYTYSFSFHSMYVDFSRWIICNFPGYRAIDLTGFLGQQKVKVVCYELVDPNAKPSDENSKAPLPTSHYNCFKKYIMFMEMAHTSIMSQEELTNAESLMIDADDNNNKNNEEEGEDGDNNDENQKDDQDQDVNEDDIFVTEENIHISRSDVEDSESDADDEFDIQRAHVADIEHENDEVMNNLQQVDKADEEVDTLKPDSEYVLANTLVSLISTPLPNDNRAQTFDSYNDCDDWYDNPDNCFGISDISGAAIRKKCRDIPIVKFIRPQTPIPILSSSLSTSASSTTNSNTNSTSTQSNLSSASSALRNPLSTLRRSLAVATQAGMGMGMSMSMSRSTSIPTPNGNSEDGIMATRSLDDIETNSILCAGDEVLIQSDLTRKYLTVHRGWWVNWSSSESGLKSNK